MYYRLLLVCFAILPFTGLAAVTQPELVTDLNKNGAGSLPHDFVRIGDVTYFTANDGIHGRELWKQTDGGDAQLVKDIRPGLSSSYPRSLTEFQSKLFFVATDDEHGRELWVSDSTGTHLLKDIAPNNTANISSSPDELTVLGETLFFTADDGVHGNELWSFDGDKVALFEDINPGSEGSYPADLTGVIKNLAGNNTYLAFNAKTQDEGQELWLATENVAFLYADVEPGSNSSRPENFISIAGDLFFTADNALWKRPSSGGLTQLTGDEIDVSDYRNLIALGERVYFVAEDNTHGTEIWRTDGTVSGTALLEDVYPGPEGSYPDDLSVAGEVLLFAATDNNSDDEWWFTKNSLNGAALVGDPDNGETSSLDACGNDEAIIGATLYFGSYDAVGDCELWMADASVFPPVLNQAAEINPGPGGSFPDNIIATADDKLLFSAYDGSHGAEPWRFDPQTQNISLLADINSDGASAILLKETGIEYLVYQGKVYFSANDGIHGEELWAYDGEATQLVADINPGPAGSSPGNFAIAGDMLFFTADGARREEDKRPPRKSSSGVTTPAKQAAIGSFGEELWKTDGTAAGTVLVKDVRPGIESSHIKYTYGFGDTLLFTAFTEQAGQELWISDETADGTVLVEINPGSYGSIVHRVPGSLFVTVGDYTYFTATATDIAFAPDVSNTGIELWRTDGTVAGTELAADIAPGLESSTPRYLVAKDGELYFIADLSSSNSGVFMRSSDNVSQFSKIEPTVDVTFSKLDYIPEKNLFFLEGYTKTAGIEPWVSDGTGEGTKKITDTISGSTGYGVYIGQYTAFAGDVWFYVNNFSRGNSTSKVWRYSTETDTAIVAVEKQGRPEFAEFAAFNNQLYFSNGDAQSGNELWSTDGETAALVADIRAGEGIGSYPLGLLVFNNQLLFSANDGVNGREIWRIKKIQNNDDTPPDSVSPVFSSGGGCTGIFFICMLAFCSRRTWRTGRV